MTTLLYAENPNLTSIYTEPNGTRVWARGFGGSKQPYKSGGAYGKRGVVFYPDVYNDFYSSHGGIVVGVDTSLTENIQLGIFGNYGDINLTQFAGASTGGGSWNPSGFGGGVMASYWEDNFYVQGLFGATAFSGDNKRQVKVGRIINETYTATKDTTSYVGALRVGAPLTWGSLIFEPQATAIWNGNEDASYKESGRYRAFALKVNSYSDNFLETTVGAKLAWPIKQEERNLLVPNLKVAWLADWDTGNGSVKFKRAHSRLATQAAPLKSPPTKRPKTVCSWKAASITPSSKDPHRLEALRQRRRQDLGRCQHRLAHLRRHHLPVLISGVGFAHNQGVDKSDGRLQKWPLLTRGSLLLARLSPYRSRRFLLVTLAGWTIFLLPVGLMSLATYTPRQDVGVKRSMAARKIGAGWVRSNPLVR